MPARARWTLIAGAALAAVYLPFWMSVFGAWPGGAAHFDALLPEMTPRYADLRVVLTALDCEGPGIDVQVQNPCDPWHRAMNYPRLWLKLRGTPLRVEHVEPLGTALGAAALIALLCWMAPRTAAQAAIAVAALASPPVLLAVERGNVDLVILLLTMLAVVLLGRGALVRALGYTTLFTAFALKLFPLAALGRVVLEAPALRRVLLPSLGVAVIAYLWLIRHQVAIIGAVTPHEAFWSYGASVLPMYLMQADFIGPGAVRWLGLVVSVALVGAGMAVGWRSAPRLPALSGTVMAGLDLGALLFVGSYLLGSNFAYRLIFVLLCWPAFLALASQEAPAARRLGVSATASLLSAYWLVDLRLDWIPLLVLLFTCAALLGARLARWQPALSSRA